MNLSNGCVWGTAVSMLVSVWRGGYRSFTIHHCGYNDKKENRKKSFLSRNSTEGYLESNVLSIVIIRRYQTYKVGRECFVK